MFSLKEKSVSTGSVYKFIFVMTFLVVAANGYFYNQQNVYIQCYDSDTNPTKGFFLNSEPVSRIVDWSREGGRRVTNMLATIPSTIVLFQPKLPNISIRQPFSNIETKSSDTTSACEKSNTSQETRIRMPKILRRSRTKAAYPKVIKPRAYNSEKEKNIFTTILMP